MTAELEPTLHNYRLVQRPHFSIAYYVTQLTQFTNDISYIIIILLQAWNIICGIVLCLLYDVAYVKTITIINVILPTIIIVL